MKRGILLIGLLAILISCGEKTKSENKKETEAVEMTENTDPKQILAIADFESEAGKWVNKEVKVSGIVDHVCKHGGKRLLLVNDQGDVHVDSETRFDDKMVGDEIILTGVVKEFVVDEAYCLKKEEDHIQSHKEGTDSDEVYAKKMEQIRSYRDSMKVAGVDHLSFYSLDYVSHQVNE